MATPAWRRCHCEFEKEAPGPPVADERHTPPRSIIHHPSRTGYDPGQTRRTLFRCGAAPGGCQRAAAVLPAPPYRPSGAIVHLGLAVTNHEDTVYQYVLDAL